MHGSFWGYLLRLIIEFVGSLVTLYTEVSKTFLPAYRLNFFAPRIARYVALKVVKSAKRYTETALDEVKLLEKIASGDRSQMGSENVIELFDQFKIHGINGTRILHTFCTYFAILYNHSKISAWYLKCLETIYSN